MYWSAGPTAVFAQRSVSSDLVPAEPPVALLAVRSGVHNWLRFQAAVVVFPSPSQLMIFSGDLYHGVLWAASTQHHTDTR